MKKRDLFLSCILALLFCTAMISSCGTQGGLGRYRGGEGFSAAIEHQMNIDIIEKNYRDCLVSAQTKLDSANCDAIHEKELDKENERHENKVNSIKEKDKCEDYMNWILKAWGYPEDEAKEITKQHRKFKYEDYSFDAGEAISELIKDGYKDKVAIQKFEKELPSFEVSKDNAEQVVKDYYENEYYTHDNSIKEPYFYLVGNSVYCNRKMLVDMGLLDDDGESDNDGEGKGDDEGGENNNGSNQGNPTPNPHPNPTHSPYQVESNEIYSYSVSHYKLDVVNLTSKQKSELDKVIAFMKKWPNTKITIIGHTCSIGSNVVNNNVGARRAHQAKLYMITQGIDEYRIEEVSKAATEPVAGNDTENGRLQNRRITFIVK
jgi:outer membrane protein OmpA-like peptidoglycan-associated protein